MDLKAVLKTNKKFCALLKGKPLFKAKKNKKLLFNYIA